VVVFGGQQYGLTLGYTDAVEGWLVRPSSPSSTPAPTAKAEVAQVKPATAAGETWEVTWVPQREHIGEAARGLEGLMEARRECNGVVGGFGPRSAVGCDGSVPLASHPPNERRGHCTFQLGRKLLVFGGSDREDGGSLAEPHVWVYDSGGGGQGSAGGPVEKGVGGGQSVGGGEGLEGSAAQRGAGHWQQPVVRGCPPASRRGFSSRLVNGQLVVSGGYDKDGNRFPDRTGYKLAFC
jgi:hypothetical protein